MCHLTVINFGEKNLIKDDIFDKNILEIGSLNINGSLRQNVITFKPKKYVGIDLVKGNGVDLVCNVYDIVKKFGKNSFDYIIATEIIEHTLNWQKVIQNINEVLKINGKLLITTRSKGCKYHGYPFDYWRYEIEDFNQIFNNYKILKLKKDPSKIKGIFFIAKKMHNQPINLQNIKLYSIIKNKKINKINILDHYIFLLYYNFRHLIKKILPKSIKTHIHGKIRLNPYL